MTLALVVGAVLAVACVVLVALPFLREPRPQSDRLLQPDELEQRRLALAEQRDRSLAALKELEDEGDRVVRDAIADLFRDPRIDPLIVIRWKDIFEALEDALDACETAANVIGNIVVKNV